MIEERGVLGATSSSSSYGKEALLPAQSSSACYHRGGGIDGSTNSTSSGATITTTTTTTRTHNNNSSSSSSIMYEEIGNDIDDYSHRYPSSGLLHRGPLHFLATTTDTEIMRVSNNNANSSSAITIQTAKLRNWFTCSLTTGRAASPAARRHCPLTLQ